MLHMIIAHQICRRILAERNKRRRLRLTRHRLQLANFADGAIPISLRIVCNNEILISLRMVFNNAIPISLRIVFNNEIPISLRMVDFKGSINSTVND